MQHILQWYNLIFYVSIMLGVVFILSSIIGVDVGTGSDIDVDAGIEHDVNHIDVSVDTHDGFFIKFLSFLGIGKCPLSIVLFTAFLLFGCTGLFLNIFFAPILGIVSVIGAGFVSIVGTRYIATLISSIMPATETYNVTHDNFIGKRATVVVSVTRNFGQIHVHDQYGSLHKFSAKSYGDEFPISTSVLIIEFKDNMFLVDKPKEEIA